MKRAAQEQARCAVVTVGGGRGFVVEGPRGRLVITAAHCLPFFRRARVFLDFDQRTYPWLLGRLGEGAPAAWAECFFVDPISDIAVLGSPDNQTFDAESAAYDDLVEACAALSIADTAEDAFTFDHDGPGQPAWLLDRDTGEWVRCKIGHVGGPLWVSRATNGIKGGMSGSPILDASGSAVGVVSCSSGSDAPDSQTEGGPNPRLAYHLPGWLLREFGCALGPDQYLKAIKQRSFRHEPEKSGPRRMS